MEILFPIYSRLYIFVDLLPSVSNYKHTPFGCAELETEGSAVVDQLITTPKGCGYNWHSTVCQTDNDK